MIIVEKKSESTFRFILRIMIRNITVVDNFGLKGIFLNLTYPTLLIDTWTPIGLSKSIQFYACQFYAHDCIVINIS